MPSAYTQNYYHTVFSTKHRELLITEEIEQRLHPCFPVVDVRTTQGEVAVSQADV